MSKSSSVSIFCLFLVLMVFTKAKAEPAPFVPVLMYHEIVTDGKQPGETVISLERFEAEMRYLADQGYTTLSMDELIEFMQGKREVPVKSVVLTFDDGWKEQLKVISTLQHYRFKASFWIITGDQYKEVYLDWPYVEAIDQDPNFEIGSHTVTHPWDHQSNLLTWLDGNPEGKGEEDVWRELKESKKMLEKRLHRKVTKLAWPCGWYNKRLVEMAKKAGYKVLLTTIQRGNNKGDSILEVKRIFVDGRCDMEGFRTILEKGENPRCGN